MRIRQSGSRSLIAALAVCIPASSLWAQSYQGGLRGRVLDPAGAVIGTAKVTLIDAATHVSRATISNADGEFVFNAVNPASYSVIAEAPGFKKVERKATVSTQQFLTFDMTLELGDVSQSVQVTEEVPLMEISNASTGQVIDRQKLIDLPNLGRNPFMMSKIAQNVTPVGNPNFNRMQDQSGSSQISIAGGPVRGNNYLLDGVPITDSVNRAVIIPTIESVQEVKVQANTFDAEMGRTGGGMFNTYMKSGTNQLHGSAFGYMRQTDWVANTFFNNRAGIPVKEQPFRNYGGSFGGPIWIPKVYNGKNKTFFFIGAEAYRQTSSVSNSFAVPTAAEINGDFSNSFARTGGLQQIFDPLTTVSNGAGGFTRTMFPGNVIPANRLNATGLAIAKTYPTGAVPAYFGQNNISVATSQYDRADQMTGKFDHRMFNWWQANFSYLHYGSREPGENWFSTVSSPTQWLLGRKVDATQFNNTITVNPTTVLTVRYGFNRFPNDNYQRSLGFNLSTLGFSPNYLKDIQRPTFPYIAMEGFSALGSDNSNDFTVYASKNLMVSAAKFIGRHSLKAGFDYRRIHIDGITYKNNAGSFNFTDVFTRATPSARTAGTGSDLASLLMGNPADMSSDVGSKLKQYLSYYAGYIHDDLRITPKLTLNMGIRYEFETGLKAVDNSLVVGFDRSVASPITGLTGGVMYAGVNGYPTQTGNLNNNKFAPRIGAAYALNSKTTVRGGYGIFWAPVPYSLQTPIGYTQNNSTLGSLDNNATPSINLSDPFPGGLRLPSGNSAGLLAGVGSSVTVIDQTHRSPIIHQYSFDLQREIGWGITMGAGYVGSAGRHLVMNNVLSGAGVNINQLDPQYLALGSALNESVTNPFYQAGGPGLVGSRTITRARALRPFPQFDVVSLLNVDQSNSRYDAFVLKAQKRASNGLGFVTTWTWSRLTDGAFGGPGNNLNTNGGLQNGYDLDAEYSRSLVDTPHRLATGITYEMPFGKGKKMLSSSKWLDYAVGGWTVNTLAVFQSGYPLAVRQQSNNNSTIGGLNQRPNATGISPVVDASFAARLDGWLNPAAFKDAPAYTFGNVSRTISLRSPGMANFDMSLFKSFSIMEKIKAQFRLEALNAMNTPLFRSPETRVGNANFGKITSQANFPRMLQLGLRFSF